MYTNRNALWLGLAFAAIAVVAYWPGMSAGFFFDDEPNIVRARSLYWTELSWSNIRAALEDAHLTRRPVANLSFALNHLVGGLKPSGYHWTNLGIHLGAGAALGWLCWLLGVQVATDAAERGRVAVVSVAIAGVFLVHPINTQAVTYIVQRMASMAAMFTFLSLALYVRARTGVVRPRLAAFGALACWLLALGSKETAVCLPLVIALYEVCYHRTEWKERLARMNTATVVAVAMAVGVCAIVAGWVLARQLAWGPLPERTFSGFERVLTQPRVHVLYLSLVVWPVAGRLGLEHDFSASTSLVSPWTTLPAVLAVLLLFVGAIWLVRRRPAFGFPVAGYLVAHMLESLPVNIELVFEHRMYLPIGFLLLGLAMVLLRLPKRRGTQVLVVTLLASLLFAGATFKRNEVWADGLRFLKETARNAPDKFRPSYNLGTALIARGDFAGAELALLHAISIDPKVPEAHNQLANASRFVGRIDQAIMHYRIAIELPEGNVEALYNLATTLEQAGKRAEAIPYYRRFIEEAPEYLGTAVNNAKQRLRALEASQRLLP